MSYDYRVARAGAGAGVGAGAGAGAGVTRSPLARRGEAQVGSAPTFLLGTLSMSFRPYTPALGALLAVHGH